MGVTGLWTVVHPCARPVKIETLNKKRLAVDASIWIYQFLKAVRDKEGNALRNSHVVGFFRRICKLLYFGIKPVFVFDGGAPALKRQTINNRKRRREGRREDAVRTAGKLLALQMQRLAEDEDRKRKEARNRDHPPDVEDEGPLPENPVYVEELNMTPQERQQNRKFKKKDAYHLPDLAMSLSEMGGPNDPRIMSLEELEQYALQFNNGEDINLYDFSKIDFDSPFFLSLPDADRYNILNAARIRSRLRMGYSKEQLDTMFPDRMAFSRFQIERVRERNELTQRLMHISGMSSDGTFGPDGRGRVAGEKNREYVLVKNDGAEGGWALGVVSGKEEGRRDRPIDVEKLDQPDEADDEDLEEDDDFEDVPIEGLNRLPKPKPVVSDPADTPQMALVKDMAKRRQAFYTSRRQGDSGIASRASDSLFVEHGAGEMETLGSSGKSGLVDEEEEADLQKAIAMSLQSQDDGVASEGDDEDDYREVFQQSRVDDPLPFAKGASQSIARIANARSNRAANQPAATAVSDDESDTDLRTALEESRRTKQSQPARFPDRSSPPVQNKLKRDASKQQPARIFDGPLPFESLNLGSSLLGRKRKENTSAADNEGGFEKQPGNGKKKTEPRPLPPWLQDDLEKQQARQAEERRQKEEDAFASRRINYSSSSLRRRKSPDVIDLDEIPEPKETVVIDSSDDGDIAATVTKDTVIRAEEDAKLAGPSHTETTTHRQDVSPSAQANNEKTDDPPFDWEKTDDEDQQIQNRAQSSSSPDFEDVPVGSTIDDGAPVVEMKSPSPEFEDVPIVEANPPMEALVSPGNAPEEFPNMADDEAIQGESEDEDFYSDPEDEQLFQSLAAEAEEHARFAATWNNKSVVENALDYERELKQLRNQQKKDRRDADEVTQTMIKECQQLLTLFGLPYITAPMEAEAQCAELVSLGLVDGIVTDDSDIFLFGGTRVYKNMFNQAKFVECYLYSDLVSELGLDRKKLIAVAQLLGSDYTEGLPGVGPVTAMEILSEFGSLDAFKDWWTRVQNGTLPLSADNGPGVSSFRRKFRKAQATKLFLPPSFPDPRVEMAYLKPEVDSDPSAFQWGVPDLEALREFLMATIGWSRDRTDEVLVPVIRDMNKRETEGTQSNITAFFDGTVGAGAFAPRRREQGTSKRLMGALGRIREQARGAEERSNNIQDSGAGTSSADPRRGDGNLGEAEAGSRPAGKRKRKGTVRHKESTTPNSSESGDEEYEEPRRKVRKGARGKSGN